MAKSVKDTVIGIIAEQALVDPADIALTTTPADLGLDSLGLVEAVFAIEEAFELDTPFGVDAPRAQGFASLPILTMIHEVEALLAKKSR